PVWALSVGLAAGGFYLDARPPGPPHWGHDLHPNDPPAAMPTKIPAMSHTAKCVDKIAASVPIAIPITMLRPRDFDLVDAADIFRSSAISRVPRPCPSVLWRARAGYPRRTGLRPSSHKLLRLPVF